MASRSQRPAERVPIPLLPGMRFHDPRAAAKFKPQTLRVESGVFGVFDHAEKAPPGTTPSRLVTEEEEENMKSMANLSLNSTRRGKPAAEQEPVRPRSARARHEPEEDERWRPSSAAYGRHSTNPEERPAVVQQAWCVHDANVLRFYAYMEEEVGLAPHFQKRVRKFSILFHLEDGSLEVLEAKEHNSGLVQGQFLKRMRVPTPTGYVGLQQLQVGRPLTLYGREFYLTGVDTFTRAFLEREGLQVPPDQPCPASSDVLQIYMARGEVNTNPLQSKMKIKSKAYQEQEARTNQFLKYDRQVLRFSAAHDTRAEDPYNGERRCYVVHYYLSDDTIEVLEVIDHNSGRDPFPKFLNRMKLPKEVHSLGARPMSQASKKRMAAIRENYHYEDLKIGGYINVFNRHLLLNDCDAFTRNFYMENCGRTLSDFCPVSDGSEIPAALELDPPPHNGFGTEEDSRLNCFQLCPKAPIKPLKEFQNNDGKVMRFSAYFVDDPRFPVKCAADAQRQFVVTFHVVDGTVAIYEPPVRNSGMEGRKFLERRRVQKPNASTYYEMKDLYVGARLLIHSRVFELAEADSHTLRFMTSNKHTFWRSDPNKVIQLIKSDLRLPMDEAAADRLRGALIEQDANGTGELTLRQAQMALTGAGCQIGQQEVITLSAYLTTRGADDAPCIGISKLLAALDVVV